jgi:hypothetical protein
VHTRRHLGAEITGAARVAEQLVNAAAVGARPSLRQRRRQPGVALPQGVDEAREIGVGPLCRADPGREVAAGQERAFGPRPPAFAEQCPTRSAASSASLRKVVILPPQTLSSGAAAVSARAGSRA